MRTFAAGALALALAVVATPLVGAAHDQMQGEGAQRGHQRGAQHASADVRQVQERLKDIGYDPGPVDGVMGSRTKEALRKFQQAQNLAPTGRLDNQTLASLNASERATSGTGASGAGRRGMEQQPESGRQPGDEGAGTPGGKGAGAPVDPDGPGSQSR